MEAVMQRVMNMPQVVVEKRIAEREVTTAPLPRVEPVFGELVDEPVHDADVVTATHAETIIVALMFGMFMKQ